MKIIIGARNEICEKINYQFPIVLRLVVDNEGVMIGIIYKKYNGNKDNAITIAKEISHLIFNVFPDASNIQSTMGAMNEVGEYKFYISANFQHLYEVNRNEYTDIFRR